MNDGGGGGVSAARKESFKKGIEDKTRKRDEQATLLRKEKRGAKLEGKRKPPQAALDGQSFEQLRQRYNRNLIIAGDHAQLKLLEQLFQLATAEQVEPWIESDGKIIIPLLVKNLSLGGAASLVNLTSTKNRYSVDVLKAIVDCGFWEQALKATTSSIELRCDIWVILYNMVVSCKEGAQVVLESPLLRFSTSTSTGDASLATPFARDLKIVSAAETPSELRERILPDLMGLVCAIYEGGFALPPRTFLLATWNVVVRTLHYIPAIPFADMPEAVKHTLAYVASCIKTMICRMPEPKEYAVYLIQLVEPVALMRKMGQLSLVADLINRVRLVEAFVQISALPLEESNFQRDMKTSGCVPIMIKTAYANEQCLRLQGYLWIGNYMADGVEFVMDMMEAGVMPAIFSSIQRDVVDIKKQAIYALMLMFNACDFDRRERMDKTKIADGLMRTIVHKFHLFETVCQYLGIQGQEKMTVDILNLMATGLKWNYAATMEAIEHAEGYDKVCKIQELKGNKLTAVYKAAVEVDDLIHKRDPECRMDVELPELPSGVFAGGFAVWK